MPDTNALLFNPQLGEWSFADVPRFMLALLPTVLAELDEQKVNHRNEAVRLLADGLITRIKGYRARGSIIDGVTLRKETSKLRAWVTEPKMADSLPWLDPANNDDRLLAGVIEVMREYVHSPVAVVTCDINLQNKAEFARIPFTEPPEPPGHQKFERDRARQPLPLWSRRGPARITVH